MCTNSGCSTTNVNEHTASATGLPNTGSSNVTVQVASGHINIAMYDTTVPLGLGTYNKASVLADNNLVDSLCGVAPMADAGLISIFHPGNESFASYCYEDVTITFSGPPVIEGFCDTNLGSKSGMWRVPMQQPRHAARHGYSFAAQTITSTDLNKAMQAVTSSTATETAHNVNNLPSIEQAVHWMHACMGYPATATWIKACHARNVVGFPFADEKYIRKYFPENDETAAGHIQRQRQNICSTKPKAAPLASIDTTDLHGQKERDVYVKIVELKMQSTLIKPDGLASHHRAGCNISWSWSRLTATPFL